MDMKSVSHMGLDCHRKFSKNPQPGLETRSGLCGCESTIRPGCPAARVGQVPWRTPVVLEGLSDGCWLSDELRRRTGSHLASSRKAAHGGRARGWPSRTGSIRPAVGVVDAAAALVGVWLAPPECVVNENGCATDGPGEHPDEPEEPDSRVLHRHGIMHEFSDLFRLRTEVPARAGGNSVRLPESGRATLKGIWSC